MKALQLGKIAIDVVVETPRVPMTFAEFLPDSTREALAAERNWLEPAFADLDQGVGFLAFHSYLLRTPRGTVLVDACIGNDKDRGGHAAFHRLNTPWLENLRAAGVRPEDVDFVMCTHMHADHVGWNTRLIDGRWVPTFPKARYVFARTEYQHRRSAWQADGNAGNGAFADSVLPIEASGQAMIVDGDYELDEYLRLEPAPGHTPGNVVVHAQSQGRRAVLSGDVIHHPIQVCYPEWSALFCEDRMQSAQCRQAFVERHTDTATIILPAHFPAPTAGRIQRRGGRWRFDFLDT